MSIFRKWTAIRHITSILILQDNLKICLSICKTKFLHIILHLPLSPLLDFWKPWYEIFSVTHLYSLPSY